MFIGKRRIRSTLRSVCIHHHGGHRLLKDIDRNGYNCIGKPEALSGNLSGFWSVRIDEKNRIVFRIENGSLEIAECGSHYGDK